MGQLVEHLSSNGEALSSNPRAILKKILLGSRFGINFTDRVLT
jgi:hypothetical protein